MKVTGVGSTRPTPGRKDKDKKTGGEGGEAFADALSRSLGKVGAPSGGEAPAPVRGTDALLAAQEASGDHDREAGRRALRRGETLLDRLEEIRHGLLLGAIPKDRLVELARLARERRDGGADPRLSLLLDEIELRAEVELAKLSRTR